MSDAIIIGSDHAGFAAKEQVKAYLQAKGMQVTDVGCHSEESVHYPLYARAVASAVSKGEFERGILICGTGLGMSIAANRFPGVRATVCHNEFTTAASREHNDSNVLCLGARVMDTEEMKKLVELWLTTQFAGGRHAERIAMFDEK